MNGFLVLLSCTMDDFPIFFTDSRGEAMRVAKRHNGVISNSLQDMFGIDATESVCVKVVSFVNGSPIRVRIVKEFDK